MGLRRGAREVGKKLIGLGWPGEDERSLMGKKVKTEKGLECKDLERKKAIRKRTCEAAPIVGDQNRKGERKRNKKTKGKGKKTKGA